MTGTLEVPGDCFAVAAGFAHSGIWESMEDPSLWDLGHREAIR